MQIHLVVELLLLLWGLLSSEMNYDDILVHLGESGPWQILHCSLLWLPPIAAGMFVLQTSFTGKKITRNKANSTFLKLAHIISKNTFTPPAAIKNQNTAKDTTHRKICSTILFFCSQSRMLLCMCLCIEKVGSCFSGNFDGSIDYQTLVDDVRNP